MNLKFWILLVIKTFILHGLGLGQGFEAKHGSVSYQSHGKDTTKLELNFNNEGSREITLKNTGGQDVLLKCDQSVYEALGFGFSPSINNCTLEAKPQGKPIIISYVGGVVDITIRVEIDSSQYVRIRLFKDANVDTDELGGQRNDGLLAGHLKFWNSKADKASEQIQELNFDKSPSQLIKKLELINDGGTSISIESRTERGKQTSSFTSAAGHFTVRLDIDKKTIEPGIKGTVTINLSRGKKKAPTKDRLNIILTDGTNKVQISITAWSVLDESEPATTANGNSAPPPIVTFPLKVRWPYGSDSLKYYDESVVINDGLHLPSTAYKNRKIILANISGKEVECQLKMSDEDAKFCEILDWQNPKNIGIDDTIEVPLQFFPHESGDRTWTLNIKCKDQNMAFSVPLEIPQKARGKLEVEYKGQCYRDIGQRVLIRLASNRKNESETIWIYNSGIDTLSLSYMEKFSFDDQSEFYSFNDPIRKIKLEPGGKKSVILTFTPTDKEPESEFTLGITDGHHKVKILIQLFDEEPSNWWWLTLGVLPILVIVFRKKLLRLLKGKKPEKGNKPKKQGDPIKRAYHPLLGAFKKQQISIENMGVNDYEEFVSLLKEHLEKEQSAQYDKLKTLGQMTQVLQSQSKSSSMTSQKNRELEAFQQKLLESGLRKEDFEYHPAWVKYLLELNVYHDDHGISTVSEWKQKAGILEDVQPKAEAFDTICSSLKLSSSSIQNASDKVIGWANQSAFGLPVAIDEFFDQIDQGVELLEGIASKMPPNHVFHKEMQIILSGPNGNRGLRYAQQVSKDREGLLLTQLKLNGLHELATVSASHFYAKFISQLLMDPLNRLARLYVFAQSDFSFFERNMGPGTSEFKTIKDSFEGLKLSLMGLEIEIINPRLGSDVFSQQEHTEGISSEWLQELREDVDRLAPGTIYDMLRIGIKAWEGKAEELNIKPQVMYKH